MIKHYKTIRSSLKDKNIYIWDVGIRCIQVFSHLACRGIRVKGFVTNFDEYVGNTICALPVISPEEFAADENGIIIVHDAVGPGTFSLVCGYGAAFRYSDAMQINEDLEGAEFYLYGTGAHAWKIIKDLKNRDMILKAFIESNPDCAGKILDIPVITPGDLSPAGHATVIISSESQRWSLEMLETLCRNGFKGDVYVSELLPFSDRWGLDPFLMLDLVAREQRKLFLCCEEELGSEWLHSMLELYGFSYAREVCYEGSEQRELEDIWSLAEEDPEQSALLIFALDPERRADIIEAAKEIGFTEEGRNYSGIQECCYNRAHLAGPLLYEVDKRLVFSLDYSPVGGIPGWAIYGNEEKATKKILVLGGSTSSEVYIPENWVSRLQRLCTEHGFHTAVYNGAYEGNMAIDELIRLTRGLQTIKPDIVISMSGLNDMKPALNKFEKHYGENEVEHWRRIELYMKEMTEAEGAAFFAFMQPINNCMRASSFDEALMFIQEGHFNRKTSSMDLVSSDDFYCNMIDRFHHRPGMFIDSSHYSGPGHEEIAKYVFEIIKGALA